MIKAGDKVVCVRAEFSLCPLHNEKILGPDPLPEMVGQVYTVAGTANWARENNCIGYIVLEGSQDLWCVGCFRKVEKADSEFIESLQSCKPKKEVEPA